MPTYMPTNGPLPHPIPRPLRIEVKTPICGTWTFAHDEVEEAKLAMHLSELAEKTGISPNDFQHIFPMVLRMMKSKSEWAK